VSTLVNAPANDNPECMAEVAPEAANVSVCGTLFPEAAEPR
jgi:hypothetical protein